MNSFVATAFLLVWVTAGVQSADRDLGELCTSIDSCVHPSLLLVCDTVTATCAIQQDQACSAAGYSDYCVTGAECTGSTCTCKSPVYTTGTGGKCAVTQSGKWGATCSSSSSCGSGLFCSAINGVCVCSSGKSPNLSTGECSDIPAQRIGRTCTVSTASTDCGTSSNLQCHSAYGSCQCAAGYTGPLGGTCSAFASGYVGYQCSGNADCSVPADCNSSICTCPDSLYGVPGGTCYAKARTLGGGCTRCSATNNICTGTGEVKTCQCQVGLEVSSSGRECAVPDNKVGGSCSEDSDCEDANAVCTGLFTKTCTCNLFGGFIGVNGGGCTDLFGAASTPGVPVMSLLAAVALSVVTTA